MPLNAWNNQGSKKVISPSHTAAAESRSRGLRLQSPGSEARCVSLKPALEDKEDCEALNNGRGTCGDGRWRGLAKILAKVSLIWPWALAWDK